MVHASQGWESITVTPSILEPDLVGYKKSIIQRFRSTPLFVSGVCVLCCSPSLLLADVRFPITFGISISGTFPPTICYILA